MDPIAEAVATGSDAPDAAVAFEAVTKHFGATVANDRVSFRVRRGTIHGLVGENGAGKTTLMQLLYGVHQPDGGCIIVDGRRADFRRPRDAIAAGIGMIHQQLSLVPPLSVLENVILGREPRRAGRVDWSTARARVQQIARDHGLTVPLETGVAGLDIATRQRVEILKALYRNARVLVLDEPTTVLAAPEYEALVRSLRGFAAGGGTIIYISHRLPEIMDLCDRVTVMRRGRLTYSGAATDVDVRELARLMVGNGAAPVASPRAPRRERDDEVVLDVRDVVTPPRPGDTGLDRVSFSVRRGEILGIAGVAGNGQAALARTLVGLEPVQSGAVTVDGDARWGSRSLRRRRCAGLAWIPADRRTSGIVGPLSVADNLLLGRHGAPPFARIGVRRRRAVHAAAQAPMAEFDVQPADAAAPAGALSGGNQQKLLVAREVERRPRLLVAEYPTRGVDVRTLERIHARLRALAADGTAILLVGADLDELFAVAHRVAVMYRGRIVRIVSSAEASPADVAPFMGGLDPEGTAGGMA